VFSAGAETNVVLALINGEQVAGAIVSREDDAITLADITGKKRVLPLAVVSLSSLDALGLTPKTPAAWREHAEAMADQYSAMWEITHPQKRPAPVNSPAAMAARQSVPTIPGTSGRPDVNAYQRQVAVAEGRPVPSQAAPVQCTAVVKVTKGDADVTILKNFEPVGVRSLRSTTSCRFACVSGDNISVTAYNFEGRPIEVTVTANGQTASAVAAKGASGDLSSCSTKLTVP
jgi:hypothetical protein